MLFHVFAQNHLARQHSNYVVYITDIAKLSSVDISDISISKFRVEILIAGNAAYADVKRISTTSTATAALFTRPQARFTMRLYCFFLWGAF